MTAITPAASPTNANVAYSATSVALFGLNRNVKARTVFNDTDKPCYISFGAAAASTTNFTVKLAAATAYTFPTPTYNNQCTIIWDAAGTGAARTTEY